MSFLAEQQKTLSRLGWILLAVFVQALIGASMVPTRYLQAVAGLPGLALVSMSDFLAFSVMSWQVMPHIPKAFWRSKTLWLLILIVIVRTILLTFALRFTKAYLVQLINLMAPFLVVLLNRIIFKRRLPPSTLLAIMLSVFGGVLMVFGNLSGQNLALTFSSEDVLGIILAFLGTLGIAAYMLIVKRSQEIGLPAGVVYIGQITALMVVMGILSLGVGEDWRSFLTLDWRGWLAFILIAFGIEIGGKNGNIAVLRKLGLSSAVCWLSAWWQLCLQDGWFWENACAVLYSGWARCWLLSRSPGIYPVRQRIRHLRMHNLT